LLVFLCMFSYLWGTLKYNDTNKIVKFVIISTLKQNVCLLPTLQALYVFVWMGAVAEEWDVRFYLYIVL
jgi:hypothetical protein